MYPVIVEHVPMVVLYSKATQQTFHSPNHIAGIAVTKSESHHQPGLITCDADYDSLFNCILDCGCKKHHMHDDLTCPPIGPVRRPDHEALLIDLWIRHRYCSFLG